MLGDSKAFSGFATDDLETAQRFYGEGREWRKIAAANPGVLTGGPDRLVPGWQLLIPDVDPSMPLRHPVEGDVRNGLQLHVALTSALLRNTMPESLTGTPLRAMVQVV